MVRVASEVAETLLRRFPTDTRANYLAGQLYLRFGLSAEAKQLWEFCLLLNPNDSEARMSLATLFFESGEFNQAEQMLLVAYEHSKSPAVAYLLANSRMNQGRLVEAEELLTSSLSKSPDSFPNLILLGQVLLQLKRPEFAKQRFLAAVELAPSNPNAWFGAANACELLGQADEAARFRDKFNGLQQLQLQGDVEQARNHDAGAGFRQELSADCFMVGRFYLERGEIAEAQRHWLLTLQFNPDDLNVRFNLARLYLEQGQSSRSSDVLSPLSRSASKDLNFWTQLGQAYVQLEAFEQADHVYAKVIELRPDLAVGYAARCELRIRLGRLTDDSLGFARQAVQRQPDAANYFLLGVASRQAGDDKAALVAIQEAIRLEPQNPQYHQWIQSMQSQGPSQNRTK